MILKFKSFIQIAIGTFIFYKKFLTTRVAVNFLNETILFYFDISLGTLL